MKLNSRREGVVRVFVKTTSLHCRLLTIMCLCILLTATQRSASGETLGGKKLIRHGRELRKLVDPSMADAGLPSLVTAWQNTGLDGLVFNIATHKDGLNPSSMHGQWWNVEVQRTYNEFIPEIQAFQSVPDWGRLTDNFLMSYMSVWASPGEPFHSQNWFDDTHWNVITNNVALQARVAYECGFKGITLDTEQYDQHSPVGPWYRPFDYQAYAAGGYLLGNDPSPRSFSEVYDKVYDRGQEYAEALCSEFPDITLMSVPEFYHPVNGLGDDETLYPAFLDGMVAGLDTNSKLVLGTEYTYFEVDDHEIGRAHV